jgi:hypothetical protein
MATSPAALRRVSDQREASPSPVTVHAPPPSTFYVCVVTGTAFRDCTPMLSLGRVNDDESQRTLQVTWAPLLGLKVAAVWDRSLPIPVPSCGLDIPSKVLDHNFRRMTAAMFAQTGDRVQLSACPMTELRYSLFGRCPVDQQCARRNIFLDVSYAAATAGLMVGTIVRRAQVETTVSGMPLTDGAPSMTTHVFEGLTVDSDREGHTLTGCVQAVFSHQGTRQLEIVSLFEDMPLTLEIVAVAAPACVFSAVSGNPSPSIGSPYHVLASRPPTDFFLFTVPRLVAKAHRLASCSSLLLDDGRVTLLHAHDCRKSPPLHLSSNRVGRAIDHDLWSAAPTSTDISEMAHLTVGQLVVIRCASMFGSHVLGPFQCGAAPLNGAWGCVAVVVGVGTRNASTENAMIRVGDEVTFVVQRLDTGALDTVRPGSQLVVVSRMPDPPASPTATGSVRRARDADAIRAPTHNQRSTGMNATTSETPRSAWVPVQWQPTHLAVADRLVAIDTDDARCTQACGLLPGTRLTQGVLLGMGVSPVATNSPEATDDHDEQSSGAQRKRAIEHRPLAWVMHEDGDVHPVDVNAVVQMPRLGWKDMGFAPEGPVLHIGSNAALYHPRRLTPVLMVPSSLAVVWPTTQLTQLTNFASLADAQYVTCECQTSRVEPSKGASLHLTGDDIVCPRCGYCVRFVAHEHRPTRTTALRLRDASPCEAMALRLFSPALVQQLDFGGGRGLILTRREMESRALDSIDTCDASVQPWVHGGKSAAPLPTTIHTKGVQAQNISESAKLHSSGTDTFASVHEAALAALSDGGRFDESNVELALFELSRHVAREAPVTMTVPVSSCFPDGASIPSVAAQPRGTIHVDGGIAVSEDGDVPLLLHVTGLQPPPSSSVHFVLTAATRPSIHVRGPRSSAVVPLTSGLGVVHAQFAPASAALLADAETTLPLAKDANDDHGAATLARWGSRVATGSAPVVLASGMKATLDANVLSSMLSLDAVQALVPDASLRQDELWRLGLFASVGGYALATTEAVALASAISCFNTSATLARVARELAEGSPVSESGDGSHVVALANSSYRTTCCIAADSGAALISRSRLGEAERRDCTVIWEHILQHAW